MTRLLLYLVSHSVQAFFESILSQTTSSYAMLTKTLEQFGSRFSLSVHISALWLGSDQKDVLHLTFLRLGGLLRLLPQLH